LYLAISRTIQQLSNFLLSRIEQIRKDKIWLVDIAFIVDNPNVHPWVPATNHHCTPAILPVITFHVVDFSLYLSPFSFHFRVISCEEGSGCSCDLCSYADRLHLNVIDPKSELSTPKSQHRNTNHNYSLNLPHKKSHENETKKEKDTD
jgi:hypothetical protein